MQKGEEKIFVTEKLKLITPWNDPLPWWDDYDYPQWTWSPYLDPLIPIPTVWAISADPINLAWENTDKNTVKSEMLDEGWVDDPWEWTRYVHDPENGWMADDGVADDKYRLFGGYHARLWQMSDGDVVANAHHDDSAINWPPLHQADEYEPAEDLVSGFYGRGGWIVYAGNYWLDNEYTNEHGAYNDGWTTRIYET